MSGNSLDILQSGNWQFHEKSLGNFVYLTSLPARDAQFVDLPDDLSIELRTTLRKSGIDRLYAHQELAWRFYRSHKDQVIVTGTASGKSLCYQLAALDGALSAHNAKALFIFPTKALAQDQLASMNALVAALPENVQPFVHPFVYDGDTPAGKRKLVREQANLLITNPDMLHLGILPRHNNWADFFANLKLVVLDEIHIYRGVFGSHIANVIRRLNRICEYYGSHPVFVLTSATIANAAEHARALLDVASIETVALDRSAKGERIFGIYNPPIVNQELGLRNSVLFESLELLQPLIASGLQTIAFGRSRKTVELIFHYFRRYYPQLAAHVATYRAGYLPATRRAIEASLRNGATKGVITTNALELGIDIGSMDASISVGYPGSIASTVQQMGRAGRQSRTALSILMAASNPLDQYLAAHPEYFLSLSPEKAYVDPDHLLILLQHLLCAAYELPFTRPYRFGSLDEESILQFLLYFTTQNNLVQRDQSFYWSSSNYPARDSSLRNASGDVVLLRTEDNTIGTVDLSSAYWMVHPGAVYFHQGNTYLVENLDLEHRFAVLKVCNEDYQTQPQKTLEIITREHLDERFKSSGMLSFDRLQVNSQVTGFKRIKLFTHEVLDTHTLDMPVTELSTVGMSHVIDHAEIDVLRQKGLWLSDANDYGPFWPQIRDTVRARDQFRCRNCGVREKEQHHHVHHMAPFKLFANAEAANQLDNLVTLCSACHRDAETAVRVRSGIAGVAFAVRSLAPLFLMCDASDIEIVCDPRSANFDGRPAVILYDTIPGGIGLARGAFERWDEILASAREVISSCTCTTGCPSCVGPAGEEGYGGKQEALALLESMLR